MSPSMTLSRVALAALEVMVVSSGPAPVRVSGTTPPAGFWAVSEESVHAGPTITQGAADGRVAAGLVIVGRGRCARFSCP